MKLAKLEIRRGKMGVFGGWTKEAKFRSKAKFQANPRFLYVRQNGRIDVGVRVARCGNNLIGMLHPPLASLVVLLCSVSMISELNGCLIG